MKQQIEWVPISVPKPYENNPRKNEKAIDVVVRSISEFGFKNPIIVDKDNVIIAGHTRLIAALKLKLTEVPIIRAPELTDAQVKAFRIMDNKSSENSEWEKTLLAKEFEWLEQKSEINLELTGFRTREIAEIWDFKKEINEDVVEVDAYERAKSKTKVKLGEIYELGEHRLMCGDSTEKSHVDRLMGEQKANLVFTDPPYNVDYSGGRQQLSKDKHNNGKIINDNMDEAKFTDFLNSVYERIDEVTTKDSNVYVCHGDAKLGPLMIFLKCWDKIGWHHANEIIWQKNVASLGYCDYRYIHECMSYGWKGKDHYNSKDMTEVDVWFEKKDHHGSYQHPTQKPVELSARAIKNSSQQKDIVLDLFGGSGSTLIACEQLDRKCFMMELDPVYCQVIIDRWEKLTNKKAVKI